MELSIMGREKKKRAEVNGKGVNKEDYRIMEIKRKEEVVGNE